MHAAVLEYVRRFATEQSLAVLDIGGRNVNGTPRSLFPNAAYTVLDLRPSPDVDITADAVEWEPDGRCWDLVLCTGVFEHTPHWRGIVRTAYRACWRGGRFLVSCAGPGFSPHSGIIEAQPQPGEHYENLTGAELGNALGEAGWGDIEVEQAGFDLFATARRL